MAIKIIPFMQEHLELWRTSDPNDDAMFRDYVLFERDHSRIWTVTKDGDLIGFGGIEITFTNIITQKQWAEAWIKIRHEKLSSVIERREMAWKLAWKFLYIIKTMNLVRLQMIAEKTFESSCGLALALGFKKEAELKKWPPSGNDVILFVRF